MKKLFSCITAFVLCFALSLFAIGQQAALSSKLYKLYQVTTIPTASTGFFNIGATTSGISYVNSSGTTYRLLNDGAATLTPASTVAINPTTVTTFTLTPGEDETISSSSVPAAGTTVKLIVTTSGTTSRTLTFSTGFKTTGTLATGTTSGKVFTMTFVSSGSVLAETSRSTAM